MTQFLGSYDNPVDILLGDPSKAETLLGWHRDVDFPGLVQRMVAHDLALQSPPS